MNSMDIQHQIILGRVIQGKQSTIHSMISSSNKIWFL